MLSPNMKHGIHCFSFTFLVAFLVYQDTSPPDPEFSPIEEYGYVLTVILYAIQMLPLLLTPIAIETALGLLLFDAFGTVKLRCSPDRMPFICFRVITRGDFPSMVKRNVEHNRTICVEAGLQRFEVEVVTEKPIGIPTTSQTREVLVPATYKPKSGTIFKGRVSQYALEDNHTLQDEDWVVHLDEETLVTPEAVRGIMNFISDGKHHIGQGVISFANQGVVNWLCTLIDCNRVADDLGRMRWELNMYHQPPSGWKGCFVVVQAGVERKVNYDNGVELSLAEEHCFRLKAIMQGYSFGFVEGQFWDKSPFTIWELIQQRKRWLQGRLSVSISSKFPIRVKCFTAVILCALICLPVSLMAVPIRLIFPLPGLRTADAVCRYNFAVALYMYLFGVVKSFDVDRIGLPKFLLYLVGSVVVAFPVDVVLHVPVIILTFCTKRDFYFIMEKEEAKTVYQIGKIQQSAIRLLKCFVSYKVNISKSNICH